MFVIDIECGDPHHSLTIPIVPSDTKFQRSYREAEAQIPYANHNTPQDSANALGKGEETKDYRRREGQT